MEPDLQTSIVRYRDLSKGFRLEAEFYNSTSLPKGGHYTGEEIVDFIQYGTSKELNEEGNGYPTLRLNEFDSVFIQAPQKYCDKIDEATFQSLALKKDDVLICRTNGNPKLVGKSAIVPEGSDYAFASYLFRVRPKKEKVLPTTLVVYLNSRFGRAEIEKHLMVSNQANFSPAKFKEISIPKFGKLLQDIIDKVVRECHRACSQARKSYAQAEAILVSELNLDGWTPSQQRSFIRSFSQVQRARRVDADFFQPKYEDVVNTVKSYGGGWDILGNILNVKDETFNPENDKEYKYIELANVGLDGEISGCTVAKGQSLPGRAGRRVEAGDVIVSSIEGSLPSVALIEEEYNHAICSTGFHIVNSQLLNPGTLLVLFKNTVGQMQLNKGCSGTILSAINKDAFSDIVLPAVNDIAQTQIQGKVTESLALRQQSRLLLNRVTQAVEITIEQGEQAGVSSLGDLTLVGREDDEP